LLIGVGQTNWAPYTSGVGFTGVYPGLLLCKRFFPGIEESLLTTVLCRGP